MLVTSIFGALILGIIHSVEPDHVAAVANLSARARAPFGGVIRGVLWGSAHGLIVVICAYVMHMYGASFTEQTLATFEALVGCMLLGVGVRTLMVLVQRGGHTHDHERATLVASLGAGVMHGLAGSGAALALLFALYPVYGIYAALAFGFGNCVGMGTAALFIGAAVRMLRSRSLTVAGALFQGIIAVVAIVIGVMKIFTGIM